jgi:hypothetical protein
MTWIRNHEAIRITGFVGLLESRLDERRQLPW